MADLVITLPLGASLLVLAALVHAGVSFVAWRRFRRTVDDLSRRIEAELDAPAPENAPARGVDIHTSDGRVLTLSGLGRFVRNVPAGQGDLFPPERTLADAQAEVQRRRRDGLQCPCCAQYVREYVRSLNARLIRSLVRLYDYDVQHPRVWFDYSNRAAAGEAREHSLLRWWNLIEPCEGQPGWWRITAAGRAFVEGRSTVPAAVVVFNNQRVGFAGRDVTIHEALGTRTTLEALRAS